MDSVSHRAPRVWLDLPWQSTWYAPGGHSYLATLIADAGGDYPLRHNDQAGSLPLPLERAWQYAQTADVWIIKGGDDYLQTSAALHGVFLATSYCAISSCAFPSRVGMSHNASALL